MIYGPVTTSRIAYRKKGKENLYPQDAELNWGQQSYSAGIIGRNAEAVATAPFGQAAAQVSAQGAIHLGKRQSEELAVATAADFEAFYAARRPEPCDPATGLLLTADGSAFPVLPSALRPATAKAAAARAAAAAASGWPDDPGELRRSRKRMAELAAVADIPPAPRTPADILAALFGRRSGGPPAHPGPEAAGKTMFASVRKPAGEVIAEAFAEAHRRDCDHLRPWFAVVDGNNHQIQTITTLAADYQVKVPILIDLIHVTHYLWKAANSFFYAGDPKPGPGSKTRRPRSWPASTATCAPGSAAAPPPTATPPPNAPAPTNAQTTSSTSRTTWTTPPSSPPDGPWPAVSSRVRHAGSSRTEWKSPAPDGAWMAPKPSSSSAPCTAPATSATTSTTTSSRKNTATTTAATSRPRNSPHDRPEHHPITGMSYLQRSRTPSPSQRKPSRISERFPDRALT